MTETVQFSSIVPGLAILTPFIAALLISLSGRYPNLREAWTILASLITLGLVFSMLSPVLDGKVPELRLLELSPGVAIAFKADSTGMIFGLLASSLWIATSFYSIGYMRGLNEHKQTRYFSAFALSLSTTLGVAFSSNLFTFVLFYEILSIVTYPLVIHRETPEAIRAGRKYLAYTLTGGLALIAATAWAHVLDVNLEFKAGGILSSLNNEPYLWGIFALLVFGMGVKAALMPLHSWLPSAMAAPTPVSALLHAVAVVKAGAFGFIRVIGFVFGFELLKEMGAWHVLAGISGITLIIGSMFAMRIDNLKRRLAYSTISHLSYIVLGTALLGPIAWTGALLHLVGHGVTKITLFFCAGAIHVNTHVENVSELKGIGRQMPITMTAFGLASLSMIGLPPFIMFTSKWYLGMGAIEAHQPILLFLYLISGLLSAGYLLPIVFRAFWHSSKTFSDFAEPTKLMVIPLSLTAIMTLLLGAFPNLPFQFLQLASQAADLVALSDLP